MDAPLATMVLHCADQAQSGAGPLVLRRGQKD
jgi:hypothetical protein